MGCLEDDYQTALHLLDRAGADCVYIEEVGNVYLPYKVIDRRFKQYLL